MGSMCISFMGNMLCLIYGSISDEHSGYNVSYQCLTNCTVLYFVPSKKSGLDCIIMYFF